MPRQLSQLTLFASGPSDVESEKAALRVVAGEVSQRCERTHGVTLRVVGWPEDARPGVNADPQAEINRQLAVEYDIYVGILGSRFGTPTPRNGSGTEEEFGDALSKFQRDPSSVRVLLYFKRAAEDPFTIDLEQLQRVRAFRDRLGGRGVLYCDFADTAEFTSFVRKHLDGLIIDEWQDRRWADLSPSLSTTSRPSVPATDLPSATGLTTSAAADDMDEDLRLDSEDDELGILEYVAAFHEAANGLSEIMTRITEGTRRVGNDIEARTKETEVVRRRLEAEKLIVGNRAQQQFLAESRATVDRAADNLESYASAMAPNVEHYKVYSRRLFESVRDVNHASAELGPRDTTEDRRALAKLITVIVSGRQHVMTFQASIAQMPGLTGRFKRSRRRAATILGELVAEMSFSLDAAAVLLNELGGDPDAAA